MRTRELPINGRSPNGGRSCVVSSKGLAHSSQQQNRMSKKTDVLFTPTNPLARQLRFLWVIIILRAEINLTYKKEETLQLEKEKIELISAEEERAGLGDFMTQSL